MENKYRIAFAEVDQIISIMPIELIEKIPQELRDMISNEKDNNHICSVQDPLENTKLTKESVVLLGMIYKSFLCSPEKRKELNEKEKQELEMLNKEMEEINKNINYGDMLREISMQKAEDAREINKNDESQEKYMIEIQEKWYHKIFKLMKKILGKKE